MKSHPKWIWGRIWRKAHRWSLIHHWVRHHWPLSIWRAWHHHLAIRRRLSHKWLRRKRHLSSVHHIIVSDSSLAIKHILIRSFFISICSIPLHIFSYSYDFKVLLIYRFLCIYCDLSLDFSKSTQTIRWNLARPNFINDLIWIINQHLNGF